MGKQTPSMQGFRATAAQVNTHNCKIKSGSAPEGHVSRAALAGAIIPVSITDPILGPGARVM